MRAFVLLGLAVALSAAGPEIRLTAEGFVLAPAPEAQGREWPEIFAVYVATDGEVPAVGGAYRVEGDRLVFKPKYPLTPGLKYRAEYRGHFSKVIEIPRRDAAPSTVVSAVYPSADVLPENLLKLYVQFSAPMSRGEAYRRIRLLEESGREVELPFLELEQELWDREGRRLTLLFDPGRIKSGLVPNQEVGLALETGRSYTLVVDREFRDAKELPLAEGYRKVFRVGSEDREPLDPGNWEVRAPKADSTEPLTVVFPEPVDRALLERVVGVTTTSGVPVEGSAEIEGDETRWRFTPAVAWTAERYLLQAQTVLEDLAGNSIGRPFEVDVFERIEDGATGKTVSVVFAPTP